MRTRFGSAADAVLAESNPIVAAIPTNKTSSARGRRHITANLNLDASSPIERLPIVVAGDLLDRREKPASVKRLWKIARSGSLLCALAPFRFIKGADVKNGAANPELPQSIPQPKAGKSWEVDIEEEAVGFRGGVRLEQCFGRAKGVRLQTGDGKQARDRAAHAGVVINDEDVLFSIQGVRHTRVDASHHAQRSAAMESRISAVKSAPKGKRKRA